MRSMHAGGPEFLSQAMFLHAANSTLQSQLSKPDPSLTLSVCCMFLSKLRGIHEESRQSTIFCWAATCKPIQGSTGSLTRRWYIFTLLSLHSLLRLYFAIFMSRLYCAGSCFASFTYDFVVFLLCKKNSCANFASFKPDFRMFRFCDKKCCFCFFRFLKIEGKLF